MQDPHLRYSGISMGRWWASCLIAPLIGPILIFCIEPFGLRSMKSFTEVGEGLTATLVLYGLPSYVGVFLFGLPLLYVFRRAEITSWWAYIAGGLFCATCIGILLERRGWSVPWWAARGIMHYIVGLGVVGGLSLRAMLFGFARK
jgi:hypothetical protein